MDLTATLRKAFDNDRCPFPFMAPWSDYRHNWPVPVSHRAGGGEAPENTVAAVKASEKAGSRIMQVDIIPAADGTPVIVRDLNLKRITGVDKDVTDCEPNDLPKLKDPLKPTFLCEESKPLRTSAFGEWGRRIPTLEQMLSQAAPDTHFILELWSEEEDLVDEVARIVIKYGFVHRITIGNPFSFRTYRMCREKLPDSQRMYPVELLWQVYLAYSICMLWSFKIFHPFYQGTVINIPLITNRWEALIQEFEVKGFKAWLARTAMRFMRWMMPAPKLFKHLQEVEGVPVVAWVLNGESEWAHAQKLGVAGIQTDYPAKLVQYLAASNTQVPQLEDKKQQ